MDIKLCRTVWLFLLVVPFNCYGQLEAQRWNVGGVIDRTVVCADLEIQSLGELKQWVNTETDETMKKHLYLRIIRLLQDQSLISPAILYCDTLIKLAHRRNDSLTLCRAYVSSVHNSYIMGNPAMMLIHAAKAQEYIPRSVVGTMEEFKVLSVTGDAYLNQLRYDEAEVVYNKAKNIAGSLDSDNCKAYLCLSLGKALYHNGKLDKAIEAYQESIRIFEKNQHNVACCNAYRQIAQVYSDLGLADYQLNFLYKALTLLPLLDNPFQQAAVYRDMGTFYKGQKDSIQTTEYYNKAINAYLRISQSDTLGLGESYSDLAGFYHYLADKDQALAYQQKSISILHRYPRPLAFATYKLGYLQQNYGQADSAFGYFKMAYDMSLKLNDPHLTAICTKGLADYYFEKKETSKAIDFARIAYEQAHKIQSLVLICDVSYLLGNLYAENSDFQHAYLYQKEYRGLSDSLKLVGNNRDVARLSAQIEFSDKETQMKVQISEQKKRIRTQRTVSALLTCVLSLISVLVIIVLRNNKHRQKIYTKLNEQKKELVSYNEELLVANEELVTVNEKLQKTYDELNLYKGQLENMVDEKTSELQLALKQVQESDQFKAAFFANMSHEIRTPLNAILGFLQFINKPEVTPEKHEVMTALINSNAAQLLSLVDDIVDLSKIDSGLLAIRPEVFNINSLLDEVYADATQYAQFAGKVKLALLSENKLPESSPPCFVIDGKRIKQILLHLVDNAIKFTETGYILFGCELSEDGKSIQFFVEDTGIGILPEYRPKIFKRFWKQGDVYTQHYRGIGIGLSLCESLVQMMEGEFQFESIVGEGSIFRFTVKTGNL